MAIVGPSGAGKDTILAALREELAGDAHFHFARRVISRPEDAGGEAHEYLPPEGFAAADLILQWEAHGLRYGIRRAEVERAPVTLLNLSRTVLEEAASRHPLLVAEVTAPRAVLAERLRARGREEGAEIAARLDRKGTPLKGLNQVRIINDGPVHAAVAALRRALEACAAGRFPP
ncbi:phosphonate metabolism protein/1,5-bisphosphokinase (PRPP-forming) PhnN [Sabulicella glaciei]|uniref:phosphonate metabolism protein/1,5-bisphosphokinase (PRPP-forming) PhnN n=1 Tax=Sabulicella glaciei TaxID=2984948 RepID=UPI0038D0F3C9